MKTGDIVLVPFPFAELTNVKARPAAVITETADRWSDLVVAAISSVIPQTLSRNEFTIEPTKENGLRVKSVVKVDRLVTVKAEKVIAHIGTFDIQDQKKLIEIFQALVK
jgi:mRNA interferase MazF